MQLVCPQFILNGWLTKRMEASVVTSSSSHHSVSLLLHISPCDLKKNLCSLPLDVSFPRTGTIPDSFLLPWHPEKDLVYKMHPLIFLHEMHTFITPSSLTTSKTTSGEDSLFLMPPPQAWDPGKDPIKEDLPPGGHNDCSSESWVRCQ
jgi:hypothetical protein